MERLRRIRHVALDMDGTIYMGMSLFPYTKPFLAGLKEMGIGWYRYEFTPKDEWKGKRIVLDFTYYSQTSRDQIRHHHAATVATDTATAATLAAKGARVAIDHIGSTDPRYLDDTERRENFHGFTNRASAYRQQTAKFCFGGQTVARKYFLPEQQFLDAIYDEINRRRRWLGCQKHR